MSGPAYYTGQINIAQNDDWIVPFVYSSVGSDGVTLTPIDLTGSEIKMEIRSAEADHEAIISVASPPGQGITLDDPVNGAFTIRITRDLLVRLFPGSYVSDIVRLMPSGYQERLWEGIAVCVQGTTR